MKVSVSVNLVDLVENAERDVCELLEREHVDDRRDRPLAARLSRRAQRHQLLARPIAAADSQRVRLVVVLQHTSTFTFI